MHARSIKAVALDAMTGEVRCAAFGYDAAAVADWVKAIDPKAKCAYESGVTGFDLQKKLACVLSTPCRQKGMLTFFRPKTYAASPNDLLYCTGLIPPNDSLILSSLYQWM